MVGENPYERRTQGPARAAVSARIVESRRGRPLRAISSRFRIEKSLQTTGRCPRAGCGWCFTTPSTGDYVTYLSSLSGLFCSSPPSRCGVLRDSKILPRWEAASGRQEPASRRIRWSGESHEASALAAMTAVSCEAARRCRLLTGRGRPEAGIFNAEFDARNRSLKLYLSNRSSRPRRIRVCSKLKGSSCRWLPAASDSENWEVQLLMLMPTQVGLGPTTLH